MAERVEELKPGNGAAGYEYGSDLHTESAPLVDPGIGKTVSIRVFDFKMNPDPKVVKSFPTNGQVIFNAHAKQIATILWGDGLIPLEQVSPRVIINKKKRTYQIFVPCSARSGVVFAETPMNLSTQLNKNGTKGHRK